MSLSDDDITTGSSAAEGPGRRWGRRDARRSRRWRGRWCGWSGRRRAAASPGCTTAVLTARQRARPMVAPVVRRCARRWRRWRGRRRCRRRRGRRCATAVRTVEPMAVRTVEPMAVRTGPPAADARERPTGGATGSPAAASLGVEPRSRPGRAGSSAGTAPTGAARGALGHPTTSSPSATGRSRAAAHARPTELAQGFRRPVLRRRRRRADLRTRPAHAVPADGQERVGAGRRRRFTRSGGVGAASPTRSPTTRCWPSWPAAPPWCCRRCTAPGRR